MCGWFWLVQVRQVPVAPAAAVATVVQVVVCSPHVLLVLWRSPMAWLRLDSDGILHVFLVFWCHRDSVLQWAVCGRWRSSVES